MNDAKPNALKALLYRFIYPACVYFSLMIFGMTALTYAAEFENFAPTIKMQLFSWLFAMISAALQQIFYTDKLNMFFKVLLHYLGSMTAFIVIFIVLAANYDNAVGALVIAVVLSVIYFFVAAVVLLIRAALKKSDGSDEKYKRQF